MKVAPVDRYGGWRAVGAGTEARSSAASRLQTLTSETASEPIKSELTSGRELPVVPVKQGSPVQARVVQEGERSRNVEMALSTYNALQAAAGGNVVATPTSEGMPAASPVADAVSPANGLDGTAGAQIGRPSQASAPPTDPVLARSGVASLTEEGKNAVFGDPKVEEARASQRSKEQMAQEARQPPAEPISKLLMDHVHNMWAASRSVVDSSNPQSTKPQVASPVSQAGGTGELAVTPSVESRRAKF